MRIARFDREKGGVTMKSNMMVEDVGGIMMMAIVYKRGMIIYLFMP